MTTLTPKDVVPGHATLISWGETPQGIIVFAIENGPGYDDRGRYTVEVWCPFYDKTSKEYRIIRIEEQDSRESVIDRFMFNYVYHYGLDPR